ncbi:hypothetical protein ACFQ2M_14850 [Kitasatospora saccharophila]
MPEPGARRGAGALIHGDDSMRPRVLTGAAGRLVKAGIVKGLPLSLR